jgi:two-component system, cell cycle sensor histidine kinase and response regulator CckA
MATSSLPVAARLQAEGVKTMVTPSRHHASGDAARNLHPIRPGATILLVEDDSQVRQMTRGILQQYGYNVLTAESDSQAMWVWERHRSEIEMIIADMMIPNCTTGLDLARKLQEEKPQLRVLFTSGFSKEIGGDDTEYLRQAPFLQKPYTALSLMQSVISCFETEIRV